MGEVSRLRSLLSHLNISTPHAVTTASPLLNEESGSRAGSPSLVW
jgi:hypothetical protein